jgi:hypothetical protein
MCSLDGLSAFPWTADAASICGKRRPRLRKADVTRQDHKFDGIILPDRFGYFKNSKYLRYSDRAPRPRGRYYSSIAKNNSITFHCDGCRNSGRSDSRHLCCKTSKGETVGPVTSCYMLGTPQNYLERHSTRETSRHSCILAGLFFWRTAFLLRKKSLAELPERSREHPAPWRDARSQNVPRTKPRAPNYV